MKAFILLGILLGSASCISSLRSKRSVFQFAQMIDCVTPRSAVSDYNGYGCYCGVGGKGTPLDATDRCCKRHDSCYGNLKTNGSCTILQLYFGKYSFYKNNCETDSASISCGSVGTDCVKGLCLCDKTAAECFRNAEFNSDYREYNKNNC